MRLLGCSIYRGMNFELKKSEYNIYVIELSKDVLRRKISKLRILTIMKKSHVFMSA